MSILQSIHWITEIKPKRFWPRNGNGVTFVIHSDDMNGGSAKFEQTYYFYDESLAGSFWAGIGGTDDKVCED